MELIHKVSACIVLPLESLNYHHLRYFWATAQGVAWDETGREIWFTGAEKGWDSALYAATPAGGLRLVLRVPGRLVFHDRDS